MSCVSGHWPLRASCTSLLSCSWSPKASGGAWRPSRSCFPAAFQLHGRVSGLCPLQEAHLCLVSKVADGILPWKCPLEEMLSCEGCKLRGLSPTAGRGCRKVGHTWPQGLAKGFSQLWLNQAALPCGRQSHHPAPQLTWETSRSCSLFPSTSPILAGRAGSASLLPLFQLSFTDLRLPVL